jgi:hypothetical protein
VSAGLLVDRDILGAATATFSPCRTYRYALTRRWSARPLPVFVMLNPSTADALVDDPTIRRCAGFAKSWTCGGFAVVNLFGLRATDPRQMRGHPDPVGPDNDLVIASLLSGDHPAGPVVCAWGAHPGTTERARQVMELLRNRRISPLCLGTTKGGQPRHPLYVSGNTPVVRFLAGSLL